MSFYVIVVAKNVFINENDAAWLAFCDARMKIIVLYVKFLIYDQYFGISDFAYCVWAEQRDY